MYICPVCNGMIDYVKDCDRCGARMDVMDRVENYYDDYSPYLSYELTDSNDGDPHNQCSHISFCPNCGNREVLRVSNIFE